MKSIFSRQAVQWNQHVYHECLCFLHRLLNAWLGRDLAERIEIWPPPLSNGYAMYRIGIQSVCMIEFLDLLIHELHCCCYFAELLNCKPIFIVDHTSVRLTHSNKRNIYQTHRNNRNAYIFSNFFVIFLFLQFQKRRMRIVLYDYIEYRYINIV